jgi:alanyl-tRNA synthetase
VSSTARRIEALVGSAAVADFSVEKQIMRTLTQVLKTPREEVPARVQELLDQVRNLERAIQRASADQAAELIPTLVAKATTFGRINGVVEVISGVDNADELRSVTQGVLKALPEGANVVALGTLKDNRATLVVATNQAGVSLGVHAGDIVKKASGLMGGGGGGKPLLAQGGGPQGENLVASLAALAKDLEALS